MLSSSFGYSAEMPKFGVSATFWYFGRIFGSIVDAENAEIAAETPNFGISALLSVFGRMFGFGQNSVKTGHGILDFGFGTETPFRSFSTSTLVPKEPQKVLPNKRSTLFPANQLDWFC